MKGNAKAYSCPDCMMVEPNCSNCKRTKGQMTKAHDPCAACRVNPVNGGSGFCCCTLGSPKISCWSRQGPVDTGYVGGRSSLVVQLT